MDPLAELVGESAAIDSVRHQIRRLVARRAAGHRLPSILISGETGTGKGLVARTIHRAGPRSGGPFVDVNCAAIPETLLEAELFGFERGAFTDARRAKPGLFQAAHRGTIFLDEVGLLPSALQAKLLKALEEQAVRRLGATVAEPVDAWIISATNSDLQDAVRRRAFREDLYHRLAVLTLRLPPLRERGNDVLILAERFLARVCADYTLPSRRLARDAQACLLAYPWPGNIRELSNVIERVGLLAEQEVVTGDMLELDAGSMVRPAATSAPLAPAPASMDDVHRDHLLAALVQTNWNISRTAVVLRLARNTVRARIEKFGLRPGNKAAASPARADVESPATPPAPPTAVPASPTPAGSSERRIVPAPSVASIRWERRGVTLMRVSLVAPENTDEMPDTSRMLELVVDKVQSFGGRVSELGGTGLDASFGLEPIEDAPRRAASAALAILKAVSRFREDENGILPMRIALHSGHYMVGQISGTRQLDQRDKRQTSDILETLVTAAEPDSTHISAVTMPYLERRFELTPTGIHTSLAGEPYRLLGHGGTGLGLWGRMGKFVGRQRELELLQERWASADRGHGQVVGVVGEAGVGKSRLLWEFTQLRSNQDCVVLQSGAVALGNPTPYLPIIELLRKFFGIEGGEDPTTARDKIGRTLSSLDPSLASTRSALVALLDIQGEEEEWAGLDSRQRRQRILDAVRRLVLRQARERPVLFLLEDAHWIDSETQAVLDILVEGIPAARILLVLTYRPEYQHTWGSRTYYTQVRVDTLSPENADELLTSLLGEDPSLLLMKPLLIQWTEGNPFFLEETVRTLVETEGLVGNRGAYQLGKPVSSIQVPATVEEVLAARIDRLLDDDRRLLQSAAVTGKRVPYPVLIASLDVPEDALRERLRTLQAAEFLYEVSDFPHQEYTFKHALTQEVAYGSLPPERRRALHARILQAMGTLYADQLEEHIDQLAHHALRGQVWNKALTYLERAGTKALARSANREAATYFEEALTALKHLPKSGQTKEQAIDLRFELRNALTPLGHVKRTLEHLREANALAEELGDQRRLGRALAFATNCLYLLGDQKRAIEFGQRALAVAERLDEFPLKIAAGMYLGRSHYSSGNFLKAIDILMPIVASLTTERRAREYLGLGVLPAVFSRAYLVMSLAAIGRFAEGHRVGEEALDLARSTNHPDTMLWAFRGLGQFYLEQGEAERAVNLLERALSLCRANDLPVYIPPVTSALGFAYAMAGRLAEALPLLERAAQEEGTREQVINHAPVVLRLAEAYVLADRTEDAATSAARGLDLARRWGDGAQEAHALRILGEIAMHRGAADHRQAADLYGQVLSLAESLAMRPLVARIRLGLGLLHSYGGDSSKARDNFTMAATDFRDMGMASWLFRTEAEASRLR